MRPIDADALISEIKKDTEKAIEQDDIVGSFWLGYIAGLVIKQPTIQPEVLACGNGELIAKPEPQWIPVGERMPKDMQFVLLIVRRLENGYNHEPFISVGYIGWNHQHWWCAHDGDCKISKVEVLAWMPLPSPYRKGATP